MQLGTSKLVYSKHTFLHYIDINPIINQLINIEQCFSLIKNHVNKENVTNHMSYYGLSESTLLRTQFLIDSTQNKLKNLYPHIRTKRGLVNIVGKTSKWLFGTLDSEDGQKYQNAINKLEQNQKGLINEANLQISLSKNLINNYNKTIVSLTTNQQKLEKSLKLFQQTVDKTISNLNAYLNFQGIVSQLNLDCQSLITFLDNLEDAIMFAKLNALHNVIISSYELNELLNYLRKIYKNNEVPNFKNILTYYQLLGTQVTFSENKLIFAIHVPIIRSKEYTFYHLYPIILNQNIFIPKYPFLAQEDQSYQFEEEACPFLEEKYFCQENFHARDECTIQLLSGNFNCSTIHIDIKESVIEQITQKEVLLLPAKEERIYAQCRINQYINVKKPTLINIPSECQVTIDSRTYRNDVQLREGKPLILPEVQLENLEKPKSKFEYIAPKLSKINFDDIYEIKEKFNELSPIKEDEERTYQPVIFDIAIIFICLIIAIYLVFRKYPQLKKYFPCLKKKEEQHVPVPQKRTPENNSVIFLS